MVENTNTANVFRDRLSELILKKNKSIMWMGVAYALLGVVALAFPMVSTKVTTTTVGLLFIFFGGITFFNSFAFQGTGPFFGALLTGLLGIALGTYMVVNQDVAAVSMTLLIAIIFMVDGSFQTAMAFELKPIEGWGWMLTSALISIIAGILIISQMPNISMVFLGILIGVNFLSSGIAMIMMSSQVKKTVKQE